MPGSSVADRLATPLGTGEPLIEVANLRKSFQGRLVTNAVSFKVFRGDTMIIMGGSGCGKSTLLRQIIGSIKPDSGSIKIFGQEITTMSPEELSMIRRRFGMLFQSGALLQSMTVGENVALPIVEHGRLADDIVELMVKMKRPRMISRACDSSASASVGGDATPYERRRSR